MKINVEMRSTVPYGIISVVDTVMTTASESTAFASILGGNSDSIKPFFENVWQRECRKLTNGSNEDHRGQAIQEARPSCHSWKTQLLRGDSNGNDQSSKDPYEEIIRHGWDVLFQLMEEIRRSTLQNDDEEPSPLISPPLFFKNQTSLSEGRDVYGESPTAAFLDGCSVVINHADAHSPWIARLCEDLQRSFPHAYANTYWTPPNSQAVPAHADDRDVLIIQVLGEKHWKVYEKIPIPFPYPHEQVGKGRLDVPAEVLQSRAVFDEMLRPGDVLYMPRGFVHEARSAVKQSSFHITVALATHDWTLAGAISEIVEASLTTQVHFREALPRSFGSESTLSAISDSDKDMVEKRILEAMGIIQNEVSPTRIHEKMKKKLANHNRLALNARSKIISKSNHRASDASSIADAAAAGVTGRDAAERVYWSSTIRVATDEEKASVCSPGRPRGLNVRPECYDSLIGLLQEIKQRQGPVAIDRFYDLSCGEDVRKNPHICDATILCFVRQCVELGAFAVVVVANEGKSNKRKLELPN